MQKYLITGTGIMGHGGGTSYTTCILSYIAELHPIPAIIVHHVKVR